MDNVFVKTYKEQTVFSKVTKLYVLLPKKLLEKLFLSTVKL